MIQAVIFDMDDVLVDTEDVDHEVALRVCSELGITLTSEEEESRLGIKTNEFYEKLSQSRSIPLNVSETVAKHFEMYEKILSTELKILPGATTLPPLLVSEGYKLALVSGSTKKQIEIILSQLGLKDIFKIVIAAEDVTRGKPDPEGYSLAAARLGVKPEECVVIEDALPGIAAAKSAGMKVIAVKNKGLRDVSQADTQVEDLTQIDSKVLF